MGGWARSPEQLWKSLPMVPYPLPSLWAAKPPLCPATRSRYPRLSASLTAPGLLAEQMAVAAVAGAVRWAKLVSGGNAFALQSVTLPNVESTGVAAIAASVLAVYPPVKMGSASVSPTAAD
jgi:hypothetical protein